MRIGALLVIILCLGSACKQDVGPHSVSDQSDIPVRPNDMPPTTDEVCYAGTSLYGIDEADLVAASQCTPGTDNCLGPQTVLVRRGFRPSDSVMVEKWVEGATTSTLPVAAEHTMTISESRFSLAVTAQVNPRGTGGEQLAWAGAGELVGPPWQWTKWTSNQRRVQQVLDVVTTTVDGEALHREIAFTTEGGSVVLLRRDELQQFPCAEWDARTEAALTLPAPG
jgi:hypothetical protein